MRKRLSEMLTWRPVNGDLEVWEGWDIYVGFGVYIFIGEEQGRHLFHQQEHSTGLGPEVPVGAWAHQAYSHYLAQVLGSRRVCPG